MESLGLPLFVARPETLSDDRNLTADVCHRSFTRSFLQRANYDSSRFHSEGILFLAYIVAAR